MKRRLLTALNALTDRRLAVIGAVLLAVLAALPAAMALLTAKKAGLTWSGITIFSPGDLAVYLSYIEQAKSGAWLMDNLFDTGLGPPALHGFWLAVGWLARLFRLEAVVAYHLIRLALIPALALVIWLFVRALLPTARRQRIIAYFLVLFGGGLGGLVIPLYANRPVEPFAPNRPPDLWVSEAFPFLASQYSGHFLAAWILVLLMLFLLWRAVTRGRPRHSLLAGLCALLLAAFHPYHLVTVFLVSLAWLGYRWFIHRQIKNDWRSAWPFLLTAGLAIAYHALKLLASAEGDVLARRSLALTPAPVELLVGYGLLLPLAIIGWRSARRFGWDDEARGFLAVWALAQPLAFYGPLLMQRRLLLGWLFPLALLAAPGLLDLWQRLRRLMAGGHPAMLALPLTALLFLLFNTVPTTLLSMRAAFAAPSTRHTLYFDEDKRQALEWIRANTPADATFLSSPAVGNQIGGWAHRRVFVGHWANTDRREQKTATVSRFWRDMPPVEREELIAAAGLDYLWCDPPDDTRPPCPPSGLPVQQVFGNDKYVIYKLK